jgi:hypothetical protein
MNISGQIQYLLHGQIDKNKWDALIDRAPNGLIYARSFYLDHMAKRWDALVLNDYEAVMPLTWNKKYGFYYLYQPFLCASLGIFGQSITPALTERFLLNIPGKFRYIDISLNYGNAGELNGFGMYQRKNYVLNLLEPYDSLYSRFSDNVKRNNRKALQSGCLVSKPCSDEVVNLAKLQFKKWTIVSNRHFNDFLDLYKFLEKKDSVATYGITTAEGRLLSSCIFFFWQKRAYYILVGNHPESNGTGAAHALINAFIYDHSETDLILDFEGSDVPGIAALYRGFGAAEENYPAIRYNRLPAVLRWLKK